MKHRAVIAFLLAVVIAVSSCAKKESEDPNDRIAESFKAWMEANYPQAEELPDGQGVYVIKSSAPATSDQTPAEGEWVRVDYTGYLISGDAYATRSEDTAKLLGIYSRFGHYTPQYFQLKSGNYAIPKGEYLALKQMKPGEVWTIFIPPALAAAGTYSTTFPSGFAYRSIYSGAPLIVTATITEIVPDPEVEEQDQVIARAQEWGLNLIGDAIEPYLYCDIVDSIPGSARIGKDSVTYFNYTISFLDGFMFDTNIRDTAVVHNILVDPYDSDGNSTSSKYQPTYYKPSKGGMIDAVYKAMTEKLHYSDSARMVFTSEYAYGSEGYTTGSTAIQPYEPLVFQIRVLPYSGHKYKPYTVSEVLALTSDETDKWVAGFIVGAVEGSDKATDSRFVEPWTTRTNVLIADKNDETDPAKCIAVELTTNIVDNVNLVDNADNNIQRKLTVTGNLTQYLGGRGMKDTKDTYTMY